MNLFIAPFVNALFGFYYWWGNFGWSIVAVTVMIKLILLPLILPSLKSAKKIRGLQPKLNSLKEKYGNDKQALAKAQMDLYKQEGINPMSGCLPQILQIVVLLLFFSAFNMVVNFAQGKGSLEEINNQLIQPFKVGEEFKFDLGFLGGNLAETPAKIFKDGIGIKAVLPIVLLFGSGFLQYLGARVMMPNPKVAEDVAKETEDKEDDMMAAMRTQSLYMMPAMTIFLGWNFSMGILLYWFTNSAMMVIQQLLVARSGK
ncbi:MAG TPA: YidC/Oxa1 family membrane protein insertase [Candidatus Woesebacteria bacterium]|jgi:YidC/Oxa1 family membrane protein insertase|nr:membrane protein insertase YidC [Candidatus Shapirobacteria bacterium]HOR01982.1 YidC/Oxa1 family membrane protein insertase [Candidatus Woesebacteria bacterium]